MGVHRGVQKWLFVRVSRGARNPTSAVLFFLSVLCEVPGYDGVERDLKTWQCQRVGGYSGQ